MKETVTQMGSIRRRMRKMMNERGAGWLGKGEWQEKISRREMKSSMGERACSYQVSDNPG